MPMVLSSRRNVVGLRLSNLVSFVSGKLVTTCLTLAFRSLLLVTSFRGSFVSSASRRVVNVGMVTVLFTADVSASGWVGMLFVSAMDVMLCRLWSDVFILIMQLLFLIIYVLLWID